MATATWTDWAARLVRVTERAERVAAGSGCPHRRARAARLRGVCRRQADSWHESSRYSGSLSGPEDHINLARALRGLPPRKEA